MKRSQPGFHVFHLVMILLLGASFASIAALSAPAQEYDQQGTPAADYSNVRIVRLSFVEGDVQYLTPDDDWQAAQINLPIQEGFRLATGNGRAEVEFESGLIVRLAENSDMQFTQLGLQDGVRITQLNVLGGSIIVSTDGKQNDRLSVLAPNLEVKVQHGARFRVDTTQGDSWVTVLKGDVQVASNTGETLVNGGKTLHISAENPDQVAIELAAAPDDFDRWAADRDRVIQQGNAQESQYVDTYAGSDYSYGVADLSSYGQWTTVAGYGYCWQPFGMPFGWAPFVNGSWGYFGHFGWTWLSFEPWGWLPYHTGHWIVTPGGIWMWQPGPFRIWNPAPVHWLRAGNQFGWVPRGTWGPRGLTPGVHIVTGTADPHGRIIHTGQLGHFEPREIVKGTPPVPPSNIVHHQGGTPWQPGIGPARTPIIYNPTTKTYVNPRATVGPITKEQRMIMGDLDKDAPRGQHTPDSPEQVRPGGVTPSKPQNGMVRQNQVPVVPNSHTPKDGEVRREDSSTPVRPGGGVMPPQPGNGAGNGMTKNPPSNSNNLTKDAPQGVRTPDSPPPAQTGGPVPPAAPVRPAPRPQEVPREQRNTPPPPPVQQQPRYTPPPPPVQHQEPPQRYSPPPQPAPQPRPSSPPPMPAPQPHVSPPSPPPPAPAAPPKGGRGNR